MNSESEPLGYLDIRNIIYKINTDPNFELSFDQKKNLCTIAIQFFETHNDDGTSKSDIQEEKPYPTFYKHQLPGSTTVDYGLSLYRGVLVQWDDDHDTRIFKFIDKLKPKVRKCLLVAYERKGGLSLLWRDNIFIGDRDQVVVGGDVWSIRFSELIEGKGE